ncbi:MAG: hypothetical protein KC454_03320 [Flavobacteriales bacterium]|nr:hypothetical protein [Flavobacteriales bacterium]
MKKVTIVEMQNIAAFLIGVIVVLWFTLNITGVNLEYFPGDEGDARFNTYILEHGHQFLSGNQDALWEAPFMYPEASVISYSDNLIGSAPVYSFFRMLNFDRETSFQLWFIAMFLLSYVCCYLFLKAQIKHVYAAVLGALIFSISMALQSQMTHAQVFPTFPIPLAFWMLSLFFERLRPLFLFLAVLFLVYQFYCGIYLGFFLSIPFSIYLVLGLYKHRSVLAIKIKSIKWIGTVFLGLMVNIFLLMLLMLPYVARSKTVGSQNYDSVFQSIPTIRSFFYSQDGTWLWSFLKTTGNGIPAQWDHQIFVGGLPVIAALLLFFVWILSKYSKPNFKGFYQNSDLNRLLFTGLITILIFVRIGEYSLYQLLWKLPGFTSLRSITRVVNVELLFFSVALTIVVAALFNKFQKQSFLLFLALVAMVIMDNGHYAHKTYRTEKLSSQIRVQSLSNKLKSLVPNSVISYEPEMDDFPAYVYQIDAMLATQSMGLKTINAYTATSPERYNNYWWNLNESSRLEWLDSHPEIQDSIYVIH